MSKLMASVLDKISENNNEYRSYIRSLNTLVEELTTNFVGKVVGETNYTLDFSNSVTASKDMLVNPIMKKVESYVIKDLRSVEEVNEQFIEKINDKIDNATITSREEKNTFTNNLNNLLNNKYLEIVKIKRVSFLDEEGKNSDIEDCINNFVSYVKENSKIEEDALTRVVDDYKNTLYMRINSTLMEISDLYLNNFTNEVSSSLNGAISIDIDNDNVEDESLLNIPEIPNIPNIPDLPEVPKMAVSPVSEEIEIPSIPDIPEMPVSSDIKLEDSKKEEIQIPEVPVLDKSNDESTLMEIKPITPVEVKEEVKDDKKRPLDVEEILKIAKSPILGSPSTVKEETKTDGYHDIKPIIKEEEKDNLDDLFDEEEITKEMIRRLNKRLEKIKERQAKYDDEKKKLEEDERFVNELIESSNRKKEELENYEKDLDKKEEELEKKQKELEEKINVVMPFANAVMDVQKES